MAIDNDAARYLECGSHRGQILREPWHGALEARHKNTKVHAEDPGKRDHLRWRRERPDSSASIRRLRPYYVSGHTTIDLSRDDIFCGGAITWFSRTQVTTAEGTSEAEYVAMSEVVKEILFLRQVQAFIMPSLGSN